MPFKQDNTDLLLPELYTNHNEQTNVKLKLQNEKPVWLLGEPQTIQPTKT